MAEKRAGLIERRKFISNNRIKNSRGREKYFLSVVSGPWSVARNMGKKSRDYGLWTLDIGLWTIYMKNL